MKTIRSGNALAIVLYCTMIFWLSATPLPELPAVQIPGLDKAAHVLIYGGLAALCAVSLRRAKRPVPATGVFWLAFAFTVGYGITDELHQMFVPQRRFDPLDVAADMVGAWLALWAICVLKWKIPMRDCLVFRTSHGRR